MNALAVFMSGMVTAVAAGLFLVLVRQVRSSPMVTAFLGLPRREPVTIPDPDALALARDAAEIAAMPEEFLYQRFNAECGGPR